MSRTSGIVGLVGAVALIAGSFMAWVKLAFDGQAFAELLGIDPSLLQGSGLPESVTVSGIDRDGKFTLACGVVAVVAAILLLVGKVTKRVPGILLLISGVLGLGVAILNIATKDSQINDGLSQVSGDLTTLGITSDQFKSLFDVSWQIGIYVVLVGGVIAVIAGILALKEASSETVAAPPATDGGVAPIPPGTGVGFDAPAPSPATPVPPAAPVPATPAAPETPVPPAEATDATPSAPPASGQDDRPGDDAPSTS